MAAPWRLKQEMAAVMDFWLAAINHTMVLKFTSDVD
jgi:hypothetical protein